MNLSLDVSLKNNDNSLKNSLFVKYLKIKIVVVVLLKKLSI